MVPVCPTPLLRRYFSLYLKSCSNCSPDRRCFITFFWGQNSYFYQLPRETAPEWEKPFMDVWSKNPQISSSADGNSSPDYISPCKVLNTATPLSSPKDSLPFHSCLETLDKPQKRMFRRPSDESWENLVHWWKQLCLEWKQKSWICSILQLWDHRG